MKQRFLFSLVAGVLSTSAFADCTFVYENKTDHPVTVQGFFDTGDNKPVGTNWIVAESNTTTTQKISGDNKCNAIFRHSGQLLARIALKNDSGYWTGNKGFLFSTDRSYASIGENKAFADDKENITLSNGLPVTENKFHVMICNADVNSDDCN